MRRVVWSMPELRGRPLPLSAGAETPDHRLGLPAQPLRIWAGPPDRQQRLNRCPLRVTQPSAASPKSSTSRSTRQADGHQMITTPDISNYVQGPERCCKSGACYHVDNLVPGKLDNLPARGPSQGVQYFMLSTGRNGSGRTRQQWRVIAV